MKKYLKFIVFVALVLFYSCNKEEVKSSQHRLFKPVLIKPLSATDNTITVKLGKMASAVSYKVEISRDHFATAPLRTITDTSAVITFKNLLWNTAYQVRAMAYAADSIYNSGLVELGEVRTDRFPSILNIPKTEDIIDIGLNVRWQVSGAAVTAVKIFAATDEELLNPLASYTTVQSEQLAGLKVVKKLSANTAYTVAIYSDTQLRGYETFTTKPALPTTGSIVDLRGVDVPASDDGTFLFNELTNAAPGSTIILDGDQTYKCKTYNLDKSITIKSGYSLTSGGAIIDFTSSGQFEIAANAGTISSIVIDGVKFIGTTAKYVLNGGVAVSTSITDLKFLNCSFTSFRNLIRARTQWTSGGINQVTFDKCFFADFSNAGLVAVDGGSNNTLPNITFKNSTIWKVQKLVNNRATTNSNSLNILDCTISESPRNGQLIEYTNTTNITNGLVVTNVIFGRGADNGATPPSYDNPFVKSGNLPGTVLSFSNTYKTNDFNFTTPTPVNTTYSGALTDLWIDPLNGDFNFKDKTFVGKSTAGDPRWRL